MLPTNSTNDSQPNSQRSLNKTSFTVCCEDRWQVYYRLKELDICCQCGGFQPLKAEIETATDAIQLWSIVRRVSQPKEILIAALKKSWDYPSQLCR